MVRLLILLLFPSVDSRCVGTGCRAAAASSAVSVAADFASRSKPSLAVPGESVLLLLLLFPVYVILRVGSAGDSVSAEEICGEPNGNGSF